MDIQFEIFVVSSLQGNLIVTTVFNDGFNRFMLEKITAWIEVWKEGKCISKFHTLDELISAGRVTSFDKENPQ